MIRAIAMVLETGGRKRFVADTGGRDAGKCLMRALRREAKETKRRMMLELADVELSCYQPKRRRSMV